MTKSERRNKRPANADWSDPKKPSKRRKNTPTTTPDDARSEPNAVGILSAIPLRPSSCSRLTPVRSSVTGVPLAFSTVIAPSIITGHVNGVVASLASSTNHTKINCTKFMSDHAAHASTDTPATAPCETPLSRPGTSHSPIMATPSTHLKEFNNSRVSLVPTENSSDLGFELDAEEFSFQDWESSLRKDRPSISPQRLSWLTISLWLGRLLLLMLLLFAVFCRGWEGLEGTRFIQDAVDEMVAWGVSFKTRPDAIKHVENERQLEAAVQELLTTSSALSASQRHVDTMSKELDQVHETVSQLEQQLQTATGNMEVTRENLDATIEMLNDAKSALQKKEQQLTTLQHHMAHLEHKLEHSQIKLRGALADLDGALVGMGQTQVELDETMLLLQTTIARLQESEKRQTILKENLVASSFDDLGGSLELEGLRIELSNLQRMYALQAQELIVARFEVPSVSTDSADVAFKEHIEILNRLKDELSLRTQLLQRLEAQVEGSAAELVGVRNELVETNALLSYSEQELLSAETSHLQTKDELSSTVTELLETQSALQNALEVLLEFEEQIDSLHERLATQETLATHTINFVSTMAINEQQRAAAELVNFMTTFAIRYLREAVASESPAQVIQTYPMADAAFVFEQPQHEASIVDFDETD